MIAVSIGGLTLAEDLFAIERGIDQLILRETAPATPILHPGRMSPAAAVNLLFIGSALLALKAPRATFAAWAHWLIVPALLVATLANFGYAYGVTALYRVNPYPSLAAHTAISFLVLGLSVHAADTAYGAQQLITDADRNLFQAKHLGRIGWSPWPPRPPKKPT
jgi:hypothetical protein